MALTSPAQRKPPAAGLKGAETVALYAAGLAQGFALIIFPAAGPLLTSSQYYGLSAAQFGLLFTPQILVAIAASLSSARLAARWNMKRVLLLGLVCDLAAMLLLTGSSVFAGSHNTALAFPVLLLATSAIGGGFGFTISALNAYIFDLYRDRPESAVTGLHVLTGLGSVGAPLLLGLFIGLDRWFGAPLTIAVVLLAVIGRLSTFDLELSTDQAAHQPATISWQLPGRIWLYALAVFLYGVCETTFGNWSPIYLNQEVGLSMNQAALALSVFWGMVTVGRVLFSLMAFKIRPQALYVASPLVAAAVFLSFPYLTTFAASLAGLALAGLGMSFFYPLSTTQASEEQPAQLASVSGSLVAAIMLGSGFSAGVVGYIKSAIGLGTTFQLSSGYALCMAFVVAYLALSRKAAFATEEK